MPRKKLAILSKPPKTPKITKPTIPTPISPVPTALPPSRAHHASYHYSLLLDDRAKCDALLSWFNGVEETRSMPWRKKWIDPVDFEGREGELETVLGKRAYEIWVSEVSK
jgi:A/G-specific adenine glycosylase